MASGTNTFVLLLSAILCLFCILHGAANSLPGHESLSFLRCLSQYIHPSTNVSQILFFPNTTSYTSLLTSSIQNLRFASGSSRPILIVTPNSESDVQATVTCSRELGLSIRVRSGGHDYEGLSYRSVHARPFILLDVANFRSVHIDLDRGTAEVGAGATLGELYYAIARQTNSYGFPAGSCPTVGAGGHISGGGHGVLQRRYGLASDNVVDARVVDSEGKLLDMESIGEDLFWAIRGGGGGNFGIVLSWTLTLVPVPRTVSVFTIHRTLNQGAIELVDKWQHVAPQLDHRLFLQATIQTTSNGAATGVEAVFSSLFLGACAELVRQMDDEFPELGVVSSDCREMSWAQSAVRFAGFSDNTSLQVLDDRVSRFKYPFKSKSDYVQYPVPREVWNKVFDEILREDKATIMVQLHPHGGRMSEIPESATPYPHRRGNLYSIHYLVIWSSAAEAPERYVRWIRKLFKEMAPHVSKRPRAAYVNIRDLDLGMNFESDNVTRDYYKSMVWGRKYFKSNFKRLAMVKGKVDPENFFRNEQSIPPL